MKYSEDRQPPEEERATARGPSQRNESHNPKWEKIKAEIKADVWAPSSKGAEKASKELKERYRSSHFSL